MKKKIKFMNFYPNFNEIDNIYYNTLIKEFDVELSDDPDYIISSMFGSPFEISKYNDCIRIFHSGEDFYPDMNIYDYATGLVGFKLQGVTKKGLIERFLRIPFGCEWNIAEVDSALGELADNDARMIMQEKEFFVILYIAMKLVCMSVNGYMMRYHLINE